MTRYVLVPGACHGGWWYQPLVDALRAAGHEADAVTDLDSGHNLLANDPHNLVTIMLELAW
jgi:hypothetical protein